MLKERGKKRHNRRKNNKKIVRGERRNTEEGNGRQAREDGSKRVN
jgi:hypothetical protein